MSSEKSLTEGVLLAAASAAAYGIAYAYKSGYSTYFYVPPLFLTPSLGDVIKAGGIVLVAMLSIWNVARPIWQFAPPADTALGRTIRRILVVAFLTACIAFGSFQGWIAWLILVGVVIVYSALQFIYPIANHRGPLTLEEKHLAQETIEERAIKSSLESLVASIVGRSAMQLAMFLCLLIPLAYMAGRKDAAMQETFFVLNGQPSSVIVEMEGDTAILANYDEASKVLSGEYRIVRLGDSTAWVLRRERIGRLSSS